MEISNLQSWIKNCKENHRTNVEVPELVWSIFEKFGVSFREYVISKILEDAKIRGLSLEIEEQMIEIEIHTHQEYITQLEARKKLVSQLKNVNENKTIKSKKELELDDTRERAIKTFKNLKITDLTPLNTRHIEEAGKFKNRTEALNWLQEKYPDGVIT